MNMSPTDRQTDRQTGGHTDGGTGGQTVGRRDFVTQNVQSKFVHVQCSIIKFCSRHKIL